MDTLYPSTLHCLHPTCVHGLLYHIAIGTQGPPLQAFISAGFSPTQSPPPSPSVTPPRVRHTTSLFCTPGPHCAEHWHTKWKVSVCCKFFLICFFICMCVTHSLGPVSEIPVGHTRAHVALLTSLWASPGVALIVIHDAALIGDTAHTPCPPPYSTVHWALWQMERRKMYKQSKEKARWFSITSLFICSQQTNSWTAVKR